MVYTISLTTIIRKGTEHTARKRDLSTLPQNLHGWHLLINFISHKLSACISRKKCKKILSQHSEIKRNLHSSRGDGKYFYVYIYPKHRERES
jgi:hypothetical protein